jgi:hypothetical protein
MILPPPLKVRRASDAPKTVQAGFLVIGLALWGLAYGRYHFDYRVMGTRCMPRIAYDNGRDIFLWMNHHPDCQLIRAATGRTPGAMPLPVFREDPYWVVGGLAPEVVLTLRKGHLLLQSDTRRPGEVRVKKPRTSGEAGPFRKWRLHPGNLRRQLLHWCRLAGYRLVWKGPVWRVRHEHRGYPGLWQALRALTHWARSRGKILKVRVYGGNRVIAVVPGL